VIALISAINSFTHVILETLKLTFFVELAGETSNMFEIFTLEIGETSHFD